MRLLLLLAVLAPLAGCAGGCGEPEPGSSSAAPPSGGGASGAGGGGGGSVAIQSGEKALKAAPQPKEAAGPAGPGVSEPPLEYSAAGKPLETGKAKPPGAARLVAACRSHEPGCEDLRAALALARKEWGARVIVEQRPAAGPSLALYRGSEKVSERLGLPFAQDRGLESVEAYRKRLGDWLLSAVKALDLNAAPSATPAGRGS